MKEAAPSSHSLLRPRMFAYAGVTVLGILWASEAAAKRLFMPVDGHQQTMARTKEMPKKPLRIFEALADDESLINAPFDMVIQDELGKYPESAQVLIYVGPNGLALEINGEVFNVMNTVAIPDGIFSSKTVRAVALIRDAQKYGSQIVLTCNLKAFKNSRGSLELKDLASIIRQLLAKPDDQAFTFEVPCTLQQGECLAGMKLHIHVQRQGKGNTDKANSSLQSAKN